MNGPIDLNAVLESRDKYVGVKLECAWDSFRVLGCRALGCGLGFRIQGEALRHEDLGFKIKYLRFRVWILEIRA